MCYPLHWLYSYQHLNKKLHTTFIQMHDEVISLNLVLKYERLS